MARSGDPVEMSCAQWHEATGGIQDVDGHCAARIGMADRSGEYCCHPGLGGQTQQPGGMPEAGWCARRAAVAHHLDDHTPVRQKVDPPAQQQAGLVGTSRQQGPAHVRARTQKDHQGELAGPRVNGMLGDELRVADRGSAFPAEMGLGHQTAQPAPADARVDPAALPARQHRHPRVSGIDLGAAPNRAGATGPNPLPHNDNGPWNDSEPCAGIGSARSDGQVHAEHRCDAGLVAGLDKTHRAIESVAVGQCERGLVQRRGTFHQRRRG